MLLYYHIFWIHLISPGVGVHGRMIHKFDLAQTSHHMPFLT